MTKIETMRCKPGDPESNPTREPPITILHHACVKYDILKTFKDAKI